MSFIEIAGVVEKLPAVRMSVELLVQFIANEFKTAAKNGPDAVNATSDDLISNVVTLTNAVLANTDKAYEPQPNSEHTSAAADVVAEAHKGFEFDGDEEVPLPAAAEENDGSHEMQHQHEDESK